MGTRYRDDFSAASDSRAGFRHRRPPGPPFETKALIVVSIIVTLMLALAAFALISDPGPAGALKAVLLASGGGLVSYCVNRFAIEKGAPLAARGFLAALVISVWSIVFVGTPLFTSTFAGLVLSEVEHIELQEAGTANARHVSEQQQRTIASAGAGPALMVISSNLSELVACERISNCVSGAQHTGDGPVSRALSILAGKASNIAAAFDAGMARANIALDEANAGIAEYHAVLSQDLSRDQKRAALVAVHSRIEQAAQRLADSIPVSLLQGYAAELTSGIEIVGQPEVTTRVNAILSGHAKSLVTILGDLDGAQVSPPSFPARPGVSTALKYVPHFLPIAGIAFVAELVLPLTLFVFAYLKLVRRIEMMESGHDPDGDVEAIIDGDFTPPPAQLTTLPPPRAHLPIAHRPYHDRRPRGRGRR